MFQIVRLAFKIPSSLLRIPTHLRMLTVRDPDRPHVVDSRPRIDHTWLITVWTSHMESLRASTIPHALPTRGTRPSQHDLSQIAHGPVRLKIDSEAFFTMTLLGAGHGRRPSRHEHRPLEARIPQDAGEPPEQHPEAARPEGVGPSRRSVRRGTGDRAGVDPRVRPTRGDFRPEAARRDRQLSRPRYARRTRRESRSLRERL